VNCQFQCIFDDCGVCNGNDLSCAGCDGLPNSGLVIDACGVCGGNNSTCEGCDGVPNSGKVFDICGVCGGNGSSCIVSNYCNGISSCTTCNTLVGSTQKRYCVWCNTTDSCIDVSQSTECSTGLLYTCPVNSTVPPNPGSAAAQNQGSGTNIGAIAGAIVALAVVAAILGLLYYLRTKGKGPLYFEQPDLDELPTYENPLYQEFSPTRDNPLYEAPRSS